MRARLLLLCLLFSTLPCFSQATFSVDYLPPSGASVSGDFNRDGIPDLAVLNTGVDAVDGALYVYFGTGGGQFKLSHIYTGLYPANPYEGLFTADMDNDGNLDLIVTNQGFPVTFFYGSAQGTFVRGPGIPSLTGYVRLGDLNGDGRVDIVGDRTYINLGGRKFKTLWQAIGGELIDVNRDGILDSVRVTAAGIAVSLGRGDGTFKAPTYSAPIPGCGTSAQCTTIDFAIADFDNDGNLDVAVLRAYGDGYCDGDSTVYTYKNDGTGRFVLTNTLSNLGFHADTIRASDFSGDQFQDLALFCSNGAEEILYGRGDDSFQVGYGTIGYELQGVFEFTRDLTLTGRQDAVVSAPSYDMISLNATPVTSCPPPGSGMLAAKICSPTSGSTTASTSVTIQGSGNSPAGVKRVEIWIDGVKRSQRWADQIAQSFTLSPGTHKISVVAVDRYVGYAKSVETIVVP